MATISKDDFLTCLRASNLIDEEHLQEKLKEINSDDTNDIVLALIRDELLTKWQAKYLMSGRSRLHVGNYRLLERIRRDELGDRFFAVHEQLHRLVEIQLFPADLKDKKKLKDHFLEVASRAATIDHPNLMHVYDIDQEKSGRFFLVVEHSKGDTLDTFESEELSDVDVARIVEQALKGLEIAHANQVVHGDIKAENLLITDQQQIKILNLAMASLLNPEYTQASPISDLYGIAEIGLKLLDQINTSNEQSKAELFEILTSIKQTDSTDLHEQKTRLDNWISENDDSLKKTIISATPVIKDESPPLKASIPASAPIKPVPTETESQREMATGPEPSSALPFIQRHAIAILASAALVCILILVGTSFFVLAPSNNPDYVVPVATKGALDGPMTTPIKSTTLSETSANKTDSPKVSPVKNGREQEFLANPPENIDMNKALEEAKAKLEAGEIGKGETTDVQPAVDNAPAQPAETTKTEPPPANVAVAEVPPEATNNVNPDTPAEPAADAEPPVAVLAETVTDPPQPAAVSADAVVANPAPPKMEFTEAQLAKPFQDMPRAADLGDINSTEPTQLGKIYIPENILIACELISGREISRSKLFFELERSPTDKQRWFVNYIKRKNAPPEKMGSFFRKDDAFNFQWEPTAAQNENFNYLRNCVLKLTGQDQATQFVNLRTAVPIEGLCIKPDQGSARVESSLEWLPNLDNLIVEVDLPSYAGVPKMYPLPTTRRVSKNQPVSLVFSESAKDNYIYLQISSDVRKSLRLELSLLFFDPGNGNTKAIDAELLNQIVTRLSAIADGAALRSQQAEIAQRPPEVKKEDFDNWKSGLKKDAEEALSRKKSAVNYSETIPKLYGKQIPLRVFFQLDNHEIVLAQSSEN